MEETALARERTILLPGVRRVRRLQRTTAATGVRVIRLPSALSAPRSPPGFRRVTRGPRVRHGNNGESFPVSSCGGRIVRENSLPDERRLRCLSPRGKLRGAVRTPRSSDTILRTKSTFPLGAHRSVAARLAGPLFAAGDKGTREAVRAAYTSGYRTARAVDGALGTPPVECRSRRVCNGRGMRERKSRRGPRPQKFAADRGLKFSRGGDRPDSPCSGGPAASLHVLTPTSRVYTGARRRLITGSADRPEVVPRDLSPLLSAGPSRAAHFNLEEGFSAFP